MNERISAYKYDADYPYLQYLLENTGRLGFDTRTAIRTYVRVVYPLRLTPGQRILDVGSCIGTLGHYLGLVGIKTVGIDLNRSALAAGREIWGSEERNQSLLARATDIPFENDSFDAVVSQDLLEHLPDEQCAGRVLEEMSRVLKGPRMFHKITVTEDKINIDADPSHRIKWSEQQWIEWFRLLGWRVTAPTARKFPILSGISYGNFLLERME